MQELLQLILYPLVWDWAHFWEWNKTELSSLIVSCVLLIRSLNSTKHIFGGFNIDNYMQQFRAEYQDTACILITQVSSLRHQFRVSKKTNPPCACTFFPIPLVGDGAGDTGIKSMRFGDEDADFSKSLSLWGQRSSSVFVTILSLHPSKVAHERSEHRHVFTPALEISSKHSAQTPHKHQMSVSNQETLLWGYIQQALGTLEGNCSSLQLNWTLHQTNQENRRGFLSVGVLYYRLSLSSKDWWPC